MSVTSKLKKTKKKVEEAAKKKAYSEKPGTKNPAKISDLVSMSPTKAVKGQGQTVTKSVPKAKNVTSQTQTRKQEIRKKWSQQEERARSIGLEHVLGRSPLYTLQRGNAIGRTVKDRLDYRKYLGTQPMELSDEEKREEVRERLNVIARRLKDAGQPLSSQDRNLSLRDQKLIRSAKTDYDEAREQGNRALMEAAHKRAEYIRKGYGYSGGTAGEDYISPDLSKEEIAMLTPEGQRKLKRVRMNLEDAVKSGDERKIAEAEAAAARIIGNNTNRKEGFKKVDGSQGGNGQPKSKGPAMSYQDWEDRMYEGVYSVMAAVPGSILSVAETSNQAIENDFLEKNWDYINDKANRLYEYKAKLELAKKGEGNPEWGSIDQLEQQVKIAERAEKMRSSGTTVDPNLPGQTLMRRSTEAQQKFMEGRTGVDKLLASAALSMGQMVPALAASAIPGVGPAIGAGIMGAQAAGSKAYELNERGVDPAEAQLRGLVSGGIESLTEKIPISNLLKVVKAGGGASLIKSMAKQAGIEATEESVSYALNYAADVAYKDPEAKFSMKDLLESAAVGAISGGVLSGGGAMLGRAVNKNSGSYGQTVTPVRQGQKETRADTGRQTREQEPTAPTVDTSVPETVRKTEPATQRDVPVAEIRDSSPVSVNIQQDTGREAQTTAPAVQKAALAKNVSLPGTEGRDRAGNVAREVPAQVRQDIKQAQTSMLTRMAKTLGDSGAKAMMASWDNNGNPGQYAEDFVRVYNRALSGTTSGRIQAPLSLTDSQLMAAYKAGQTDRAASLEQEKVNAKQAEVAGRNTAVYATVDGNEAGLVYDDYVRDVMDLDTAESLTTVAKQLGLRVQMVDSVAGGMANADIQGSVVQIEKNNPNPIRSLFGHEMTHRVQQLAPESYRAFRDYVMQSEQAQADVQKKIADYKRAGVELNQEKAMDEIAADYAGEMIEDQNLLKRFIQKNRSNQSLLRRFLTAVKDMASKLTGSYQKKANDAVALLEKAVGDASKQAGKLQKIGKTSQTGMVYDDGNGHIRCSLKTYREGGRQTLANWMDERVKSGDLTGEDASDMLKEMDRIYDICSKYTDVYAPFGKWSEAEVVRDENGDAVFSVVKANGDYPMNMDFSLVCKKRRPLDAVLNSLVEQGLAEKFALNKQSIVVLNDIIRRHGFETACSLCFVDAKRFRVTEVADQFATMYNKLVRSMIPKGKDYRVASFNFGGDKTVKKVSGGIDTMQDSDLNFKEIEKTIRTTGEKSVAHKIAVHLRDNPTDRKLVRRGDFISTAGFDQVKKDNPALLSLYNSKKGSAGPKASFSDVQYLSEVLEKRAFKRDAAYAVGGVRIQSFSDYMPRLFFDYAQMIADLAAKKLPAHAYSKEAMFVQQFGQTGAKINMSLVPKVVKGGVAPGLDANGDYVWQEGQTFGSAVSDNDNGKAGFDLAVQIQNAEGYGDNCGTIAVGVSDRHIEKMLDDPDIRMIIPYHKSGLNPVVAAMNKIDAFENYTNDQNTRHKGTKKKVENAHFDFNAEFHRLGDAKAAADAYLAWCQDKNYLPKFDKWVGHPNYYKLLIDFSAYNSKGDATPQGDVRIQYPQEGDAFGSLNDLIKQGLEEDALAQAALDKGVQPILDDIAKELPAREAEWANIGKRYSLKGSDDYQGLIEKYGAIEQGENPRARDVQVPRQTADGKRVSRTVRTVLEAAATPDDMVPTIQEMVEKGEFSYEVAGDKAAIENAEATIREKGFQATLMDWTSALASGKVNKQNTATGWALYNAAAQAGEVKMAADIMSKIVYHQRNAAQAVQATRILKKMSPGAQLYGIQRSVQNMQDELQSKYGDKAPNLEIPDKLVENYLKAESQQDRDEAEKEIYIAIGKQIPSTFKDKWNAWRYLAMLFNVRTHIRNVVGNAGFAVPVLAKNVVGTALEGVGSVVSGGNMQRTKGLYSHALYKAAKKDYPNAEPYIMAGGKYDDSVAKRDAIEDGRRIFQIKFLEGIRKFNSWALEVEDSWFAKPHYANALAQYCASNKITAEQIQTGDGLSQADLDKARAYAIQEAQKATYRDFNDFSDFISRVGRYSGDNMFGKGFSLLVEGALPFRKTPANILVRAVEYSPAGLVSGIWELTYGVKTGKNTAAEALDRLSAGFTGSGLFALGVYLASQGLLIASGDDDDKQKDFDKLLGRQDYSVELDDGTNFTVDWLAPECIPVFMGAEYFKAMADREDTGEFSLIKLLESMTLVTNPMMEMSCLSSLNELFDNLGGYSSVNFNSIVVVAANMAVSYLTQGVPTLFGQGERASQEERMTTYTDKNKDLPTGWQYILGKLSGRIPGWDYGQIPFIDAWGRTENEGSPAERILNNFINPAYMSQYKVSKLEEELQRLYDETGESVYPSRADRYFNVNGERTDLTAEQYVTYAKEKGQGSYALMQMITTAPWYSGADDATKAVVIKEAYQVANEEAKLAVFPDYESGNKVYLKAMEAKEAGISVGDYLYLKSLKSGIESLKYRSGDKKGETIPNSKGYQIAEAIYNSSVTLTDSQRQLLYEFFDVGKTVSKANPDVVRRELSSMRNIAE